MRHDVSAVMKKHIEELFQILDQYGVTNARDFVQKSESDMVFQKAVLMCVGYIGELSKKLDEALKLQNPQINWRRLGTSRNIIFHDYDITDMGIVSTVVFRDVTALRAALSGC